MPKWQLFQLASRRGRNLRATYFLLLTTILKLNNFFSKLPLSRTVEYVTVILILEYLQYGPDF